VAKFDLRHAFIWSLSFFPIAILYEKSIDIKLIVEKSYHFLSNLAFDALFQELSGRLLVGSQTLPFFLKLLKKLRACFLFHISNSTIIY